MVEEPLPSESSSPAFPSLLHPAPARLLSRSITHLKHLRCRVLARLWFDLLVTQNITQRGYQLWPGIAGLKSGRKYLAGRTQPIITNREEKPLKELVLLVAGAERHLQTRGGSDKCELPSVRAQQMNLPPLVSKCWSCFHGITFIPV